MEEWPVIGALSSSFRRGFGIIFADSSPRSASQSSSGFRPRIGAEANELVPSARVPMVGRVAIVFSEQVCAPVAVEVAPDAVDMIRVVLGGVELDEEGAALHAVVVAFAVFKAAHPSEFDVVEPGIANFLQTRSRRRRRLRTQ